MVKRKTIGEILFDSINYILLFLIAILTLYPFYYVVIASISIPALFVKFNGLMLLPQGFSLEGFKYVIHYPVIFTSYGNTIIYVVCGTCLNILMTSLAAYTLSRKQLYIRSVVMFLIVFTMFFSGGLIPFYLQMKGLGLFNNRLALIIPGAINTFNLIIMRTQFEAIPASLEESARIDGANDFTILARIILPLSMPVVSVMILFYGVDHWNAWFHAMLLLRDRTLYPLQLILREILLFSSSDSMITDLNSGDKGDMAQTIKYAITVFATVPILLVYPYLQKYFAKGVMVGSIKT